MGYQGLFLLTYSSHSIIKEKEQVTNRDLPMLAVYETIDLGLVSTLNTITASEGEPSPLDLLQGNYPVFLSDPIHDDAIYVYHAFGVHALTIGPVLQSLAIALRTDDESGGTSLDSALQQSAGTTVQPILTTLSVERRLVLLLYRLSRARADTVSSTDARIPSLE